MFNPPSVNFFEKRLKNIVFNFFLFVSLKISSRAFSIRFITLVFIYSKIFNIISIGLMSHPPQKIEENKIRKKRSQIRKRSLLSSQPQHLAMKKLFSTSLFKVKIVNSRRNQIWKHLHLMLAKKTQAAH